MDTECTTWYLSGYSNWGEDVVLVVGKAGKTPSVGTCMPLTFAWLTVSTYPSKVQGCSGGGGGEIGQSCTAERGYA